MGVYACDYRDGLDVVDENGNVNVPEGPGLGVVYDWDFINRNVIHTAKFGY